MRAGITHSQATRHSRCLYGTGRPPYVRGTSNGDDCNVEASIGGGGQCGARAGHEAGEATRITSRDANREREDNDDSDAREEERHPSAPQL
jgi:hypothetical protein